MRYTVAFLLTLQLFASALLAQVPAILTYQGRVKSGPQPFSGSGHFKFALVDGGSVTSRHATANATVINGFLVTITITDGGEGYSQPPIVTIRDASGSGARGQAILQGGKVIAINLQSAGSGYSASPIVEIALPNTAINYVTFWSHDATSTAGQAPETSIALTVQDGLFTIGLGDTNISNMQPIPAGVFARSDVRVRIWFSDGAQPFQQLSPDQRITAVGYAIMAGNVPDGSITSPKLAPGAVSEDRLAPAVRSRLDGSPSGSLVMSEESNSAALLARGYSRAPGPPLQRQEWEIVNADTDAVVRTGPTDVEAPMAVWTGTEALFLNSSFADQKLGVLFNPSLKKWREISTNGLPNPMPIDRSIRVWTGTEVLVVGTTMEGNPGWRFNPVQNSWTAISSNNAPRLFFSEAVSAWTGTELIVFSRGAEGGTGARYRPASDTWIPISLPTNLSIGSASIVQWTGTEVLIMGDAFAGAAIGSARYRPSSNTWAPLSTNNMPILPPIRRRSAWTGTDLVVIGDGAAVDQIGGIYNPGTDTWRQIPTNGAPRFQADGFDTLWNGTDLYLLPRFFGGAELPSAGRFHPSLNQWIRMSPYIPGIFPQHGSQQFAWTGKDLIFMSKTPPGQGIVGGRYDPATDKWTPIPGSAAASDFVGPATTGLWTGSSLIRLVAYSFISHAEIYTPTSPLYLYQR